MSWASRNIVIKFVAQALLTYTLSTFDFRTNVTINWMSLLEDFGVT